MARKMASAEASSGVATLRINPDMHQITVIPDSAASGTATMEAQVPESDDYETVYDSDGTALSWDLSGGVKTHILSHGGGSYPKFKRIKVTSDNSSDGFEVTAR